MLFAVVKILAIIFYRFEVNWVEPSKPTFKKVRLIVFLNHTSLFEPLYLGVLPWSFLWRLARKMVAPGADKTLNRPLVGIFWKLLSPNMVSISRKRDKTWVKFMQAIHDRSVIVIAPEGRMKRANGLDLSGNPMTVKSGVADLLELVDEGNMVIAYSGGLHHVQIPGQHIPRLFKTLKINIEVLDIAEYKKSFNTQGIQWKKDVVTDIQNRLENNCPNADGCPQKKLSESKN
jgi:1-acyl-sn-glycerol-3-phosphate acyltransferase